MQSDERPTTGDPTRNWSEDAYAADELDEAADRLEHGAWERFEAGSRGPQQGRFYHPDDDAGEGSGEHGMIHGFLEHQLRERPLPTLLGAVFAGWVAGKLLR